MDAAFVSRYLSHRLGVSSVEVVKLRRSFPGISRETWLADCHWLADGAEVMGGFVFRMDTPGGSVVPLPLRREWEVYARLAGSTVPVPGPLWYEDDPEWQASGARDFFVRHKAEGTTEPDGFTAPGAEGSAARAEAAAELGRKLALVHTADWAALGLGEVLEVPPSAEAAGPFDLDLWEGILKQTQPEPMPVMTRVIAWLRDNPPPPAPRLALLKGNNGIGEEIWQDRRIVAMSDWELAHIGDPAEDFAWIQGFDTPELREALFSGYEPIAGARPTPEAARYYMLFRALKAFTCLQAGANMFIAHRDLRVQLASLSVSSFASQEMLARVAGI